MKAAKEPDRWIMSLVLECEVEPPREGVHEALARLGGPGSGLTAEVGKPKPSIEVLAQDDESAKIALAEKAAGLIRLLSRYNCRIARQDPPENTGPLMPPREVDD